MFDIKGLSRRGARTLPISSCRYAHPPARADSRISSRPSRTSSRPPSSASARWADRSPSEIVEAMTRHQRTPDHLRPVQPDRACGMHCPNMPTHGPRARRSTPPGPVPAGSPRWADVPAGAGQQLLYLPRGRHGHLRDAREARDRRDVHRGRACRRRPSDSRAVEAGTLFPLQSDILDVEIRTAARIAKLVFDSGLARVERPADLEAFIRRHVYTPEYKTLV